MTRRITFDLHGGGRIAIRANAPEEAIRFDGFAELLGLPLVLDSDADVPADVELVLPDDMPESGTRQDEAG